MGDSGTRTGRIVVAGAINTDLVATTGRYPERGETVTGDRFRMFGGGKGANQAVAAARSGAMVAVVGAVGDDAFGRERLAGLTADGIETDAVQVVTGESSGVALIAVEAGGDNRILYVPGASARVDPVAAVAALGDGPIAALLLTLELAEPVIRGLIARSRRDGAIVVLNATPEPRRAAALLPDVDVLIVNEGEALALADHGAPAAGEVDWAAVAAALHARGAAAVLITLGSAGARWFDGGGRGQAVAAPPVEVVDTTGAGDTLCGAFTAALVGGLSPLDAVRHGVVAGSLACTGAGAQPSIPTAAAIEAAIER